MHPTRRLVGALYDTLTFAVFCLLWDAESFAYTDMHVAYLMHLEVKLVRVALAKLAKVECAHPIGSGTSQAWRVEKPDVTSATLARLAAMHASCEEQLRTLSSSGREQNQTRYACATCNRVYTELELVDQLLTLRDELVCQTCSLELEERRPEDELAHVEQTRAAIREWLRPWTDGDHHDCRPPFAHLPVPVPFDAATISPR